MKDEFYRKEYDSEGRKLPKQIMAAEVRTPSIVVVDHFYNDPDEVRNWAIGECHFQEPGTHGAVGYRCEADRKFFTNAKECIESVMNGKVEEGTQEGGWEYPTNGCFQWCPSGTPIAYHCDSQQYAGVLFLTPNAPTNTGTSLYKHKATGIDWMPQTDEECWKYFSCSWETLHNAIFGKYSGEKGVPDPNPPNNPKKLLRTHESNYLDGTQFEKTDEVSNIYNRLVIFDAKKIHAATNYFGDNIHDSRLFQLFFFNLKKDEDEL